MPGERRIVLWVPDWSLSAVAVAVPPGSPAATVRRGKIVSTTRQARAWGVRRGQRQAHATQTCPDLIVLAHDNERDAAAFEAVLQIFDAHVAGVQSLRPGLAWAVVPNVSRVGVKEQQLLLAITEELVEELGIEAFLGVANGMATAVAAAKRTMIVEPEGTTAFLKKLSLAELNSFFFDQDVSQEVELLAELGISTVADLHRLGKAQLLSRFGANGEKLWALSVGEDLSWGRPQTVESFVSASKVFEEPVAELGHVLFDLKVLSQSFTQQLTSAGLSLERLQIDLELEEDNHYVREWAIFGRSDATQILTRVLWQVRAWQDGLLLSADSQQRRLAAISLVATSARPATKTAPLWVAPGGSSPLESSFGSGSGHENGQLNFSLEKLQLTMGEDSVLVPTIRGGLDPRERVVLFPWGQPPPDIKSAGEWEGAVEASPAVLFDDPPQVKLVGVSEDGTTGMIWLDQRGFPSGSPEKVLVGEDNDEIAAGSYLITQVGPVWAQKRQWWNEERPRGYLRVRTEKAGDLLLMWQGGWWLEGIYA